MGGGIKQERLVLIPSQLPDLLHTLILAALKREAQMTEQPPFRLQRSPVTASAMAGALILSLAYFSEADVAWALQERNAVWQGQFWRLITSTLVHANIIHLAFNLYWLNTFGPVMEDWLGSLRTLILFLLLALFSSAAEFLVFRGGIGLSGVVYGSFGLLYSVRGSDRGPAYHLTSQTIQLFVAWFFACILLTYTGALPVANVAHGAGAAAGYAIGRGILSRHQRAWLVGVVAATTLITCCTLYMPWDYSWWWRRGNRAFARNDLAGATAYWKRTVDTAGDDSLVEPVLISLAVNEHNAQNDESSYRLLERAIRVSRNPEKAKSWHAFLKWRRGDRSEAFRHLQGTCLNDLDEQLLANGGFVRFVKTLVDSHGCVPVMRTSTLPSD
jgi:membrane associated rhomboid family serine protease